MTRYAVALTDLDLAWRTPAGSAVLEAALCGDDEPETVNAEPGVEASVLAGPEEIAESVASGLLSFDLPISPPRCSRVYAKAKGEPKWTRLRRADDVPYVLREATAATGSPRIDPELVELGAPMDDATRAALRESLRTEGCRDALVVWQEQDVLLDGHNRLAICREDGIAFQVTKLSFPDRAAAVAWFVTAQRTRRSLTSHWAMYYLGRQYSAEKREHGRRGKTGQSDQSSVRLASAAGVGEKTVRRAAAFAEAVDALERAVPHARRAVLNRQIKLSRQQIEQALELGAETLAELRELTEPGERDYLAEVLRSAKKLRDAIDAYRVRGVRPEDRDRVAQSKPAARAALHELPLLFAAFGSDIGLAGEVSELASAEALSHG